MKKGRKKKNKLLKKIIIVEIIAVILAFAALFVFLFKYRQGASEQKKPDIIENIREKTETEQREPETEEKQLETEEKQSEEEGKEPEASDWSMEPPKYKFHIEEVTIEIKDLEREYTFAWVSDLHMMTDHKASRDVDAGYMENILKRYEELPITKEGIHAEDLWPDIVRYLNSQELDGVIFGGDMLDYCSSSNVEKFLEGYSRLKAPALYIRADHDYGSWYGGPYFSEKKARKLHEGIDGDAPEEKYMEFEDFIIVGVDNSNKNMPQSQMWMLEELYNIGKPVIAVTHVPYASQIDDSLEALSMKVRNKIYYWGGGEYEPNEYTEEYLHMIYRENTKAAGVLAGHLHASWDGMLTKQVGQHIFGPAFEGNIGLIHVKKKEPL